MKRSRSTCEKWHRHCQHAFYPISSKRKTFKYCHNQDADTDTKYVKYSFTMRTVCLTSTAQTGSELTIIHNFSTSGPVRIWSDYTLLHSYQAAVIYLTTEEMTEAKIYLPFLLSYLGLSLANCRHSEICNLMAWSVSYLQTSSSFIEIHRQSCAKAIISAFNKSTPNMYVNFHKFSELQKSSMVTHFLETDGFALHLFPCVSFWSWSHSLEATLMPLNPI